MSGPAGALHGPGGQEVLLWLKDLQAPLGPDPSEEQLSDFVGATLKSGKVAPGYGRAVLRETAPRPTCQRSFALKPLPDDELVRLASLLYEVVPQVLAETGKVENPWPNVDAHSGVLLVHYGIREAELYTVLFAVSRALGVLSQGAWSRALGLPIDRPESLHHGRPRGPRARRPSPAPGQPPQQPAHVQGPRPAREGAPVARRQSMHC